MVRRVILNPNLPARSGGLVTSALVVTILGEGLLDEFDRLRSGAVPVAESHHTVLLG